MADDKTEKATPKRREDARKEGNVARSMEINSAFAMMCGFGILGIWGPKMWRSMQSDMAFRLHNVGKVGTQNWSISDAMSMFFVVVKSMVYLCAPVMLGMLLVGVLASVIQVKPNVTPSIIKPRLSKLNPINGFKQRFGPAALFELAKNIFKITVVGIPAIWVLWSQKDKLLALGDAEPITAGAVAAKLTLSIGFRVAGIYIVVAIIDYLWQRHRYEKNLKMSISEVKQEMKQQDISPELKAAQRRRQREAARRRMLSDVPTADVIITNPTHYSVALKYDPELGAPQVVAKGVDLLALRIREIAEESGVTRVENRPLARQLYAQVDVGHVIPGELFAAVAEVLAYVYQINERARRSGESRKDRISA